MCQALCIRYLTQERLALSKSLSNGIKLKNTKLWLFCPGGYKATSHIFSHLDLTYLSDRYYLYPRLTD